MKKTNNTFDLDAIDSLPLFANFITIKERESNPKLVERGAESVFYQTRSLTCTNPPKRISLIIKQLSSDDI